MVTKDMDELLGDAEASPHRMVELVRSILHRRRAELSIDPALFQQILRWNSKFVLVSAGGLQDRNKLRCYNIFKERKSGTSGTISRIHH